MSDLENVPPGVDPNTPSAGRLYDYYLGGTEYFEIDRIAGDKVMSIVPELRDIVWGNRGFLQRAVKWLAEIGVDQFIDIGSGLPTRNNTHEAAQSIAPHAKVVYVDNDPMVVAHARPMLESAPNTWLVEGDARLPDELFGHVRATDALDFDRPIGLVFAALMHFVGDEDDPWGLVHRYMDGLSAGSYLVLSHITGDRINPERVEGFRKVYENASEQLYFRSHEEVTRFFDGLEIVPPYAGAEPRVNFIGLWGAEDIESADSDGSRWGLCAVARKP